MVNLMWEDAYGSTRPLKINVNSNWIIKNILDAFTIKKSSAILRMLESLVGEEEFKTGLRVTKSFVETNLNLKLNKI